MKNNFFNFKSIVIATILATSLVGCSKPAQETTTPSEVKGNKTIIMGTNAQFPPFEFRGNDGAIDGFDVAISKKIAEKLGVQLEISDIEFNALFTELETKKIDFIAAGLTVNPEREKNVNFSESYFDAKQVVLLMANNDTIKTQEDLKGKKLGAQIATTGSDIASKIENSTLTNFNAGYSAILDMQNDKIDAIIIDSEPAKQFAKVNSDIKIVDVGFDDEKYAIAVPKDNPDLLKVINEVINELKSTGEYDTLIDKYFKE